MRQQLSPKNKALVSELKATARQVKSENRKLQKEISALQVDYKRMEELESIKKKYDILLKVANDNRKALPKEVRPKRLQEEMEVSTFRSFNNQEMMKFAREYYSKRIMQIRTKKECVHSIFGYPVVERFFKEHKVEQDLMRELIIVSMFEWFRMKELGYWGVPDWLIKIKMRRLMRDGWVDEISENRKNRMFKASQKTVDLIQSYEAFYNVEMDKIRKERYKSGIKFFYPDLKKRKRQLKKKEVTNGETID